MFISMTDTVAWSKVSPRPGMPLLAEIFNEYGLEATIRDLFSVTMPKSKLELGN